MLFLGGFAAAMVWMYYHKMRRASLLLHDLTGTARPAPGTAAALPAPAAPVAVEQPLTGPSLPDGKKWSGMLRVGRIFQETPDVKTFRLMNPLGGMLPFSYLPGQFITVPIDGKPVKRIYTIASGR